MFGNPAWFREKRIGWGLVPVSWQGWGYTAAWAFVLLGPFCLLASRALGLESLIWLIFSMGVFLWDVREIIQAKRAECDKDVLYLGDEEVTEHQATTDRFSFRWR